MVWNYILVGCPWYGYDYGAIIYSLENTSPSKLRPLTVARNCNVVTAKKSCNRFFHLNNISRAFLPGSQWHCPKSITCHFLQSMRRHFSPVKPADRFTAKRINSSVVVIVAYFKVWTFPWKFSYVSLEKAVTRSFTSPDVNTLSREKNLKRWR